MRAKLKDGQLVYCPYKEKYEGKVYKPVPDDIQEKLGYKLVVETEPPTCAGETHAEPYWKETKTKITRMWNIVEDDNTTKAANRRYWFDNDYRKWNEMFTRYERMGIQETITDNYRGKTYTSLSELYAEGEIVRAEILELEERDAG